MKFSGKFASAAIFAAFGVAAMAAADIGPFSSIRQLTQTATSVEMATPGFAPVPKTTLDFRLNFAGPSAFYRNDDLPVLTGTKVFTYIQYPNAPGGLLRYQLRLTGSSTETLEFDFTGPNGSDEVDLSHFENDSRVTATVTILQHVNGQFRELSKTDPLAFRIDTEGPVVSNARFTSGQR